VGRFIAAAAAAAAAAADVHEIWFGLIVTRSFIDRGSPRRKKRTVYRKNRVYYPYPQATYLGRTTKKGSRSDRSRSNLASLILFA